MPQTYDYVNDLMDDDLEYDDAVDAIQEYLDGSNIKISQN